MKTILTLAIASAAALAASSAPLAAAGAAEASTAPARDTRCFELRIYHAAPGKLDALNARFRDHTCKLFEKHGMSNLGYWMPLDNTNNLLIYLLAFPSRDAANKSWKDFGADPEWKAVAARTEADGRLVTRADSTYLSATDFSPAIKPSAGGTPRTFELRTYKAQPGKLAALHARFRDHTVGLFAKHGMGQFGYFRPLDAAKGADDTLIYILVHKSKPAADEAFAAFRADPDWVAAKAASEKDGPLTLPAPDGVKSLFMQPTDYSPAK
jgi:hypothetical protein